jgi:hypothetical protein
MYSDSVEDKATELCFFDEYNISPPAMVNTKPDIDSGSSSPPQFASFNCDLAVYG